MSNQSKLYAIMCKCMNLQESIELLDSDTEVFMEDDICEINEYLSDVLDILMRYMPSFVSYNDVE